jgi:hypothetical protein
MGIGADEKDAQAGGVKGGVAKIEDSGLRGRPRQRGER